MKNRSQSESRSQIFGIETRIPLSTPDQDQKQLDGELRKEVQIAWPSLDQKQLDELITPQTEHPDLTVGKIYGALLMFEHWKAYKNRQQDNKDCFVVGKTTQSRAESFASIVS